MRSGWWEGGRAGRREHRVSRAASAPYATLVTEMKAPLMQPPSTEPAVTPKRRGSSGSHGTPLWKANMRKERYASTATVAMSTVAISGVMIRYDASSLVRTGRETRRGGRVAGRDQRWGPGARGKKRTGASAARERTCA